MVEYNSSQSSPILTNANISGNYAGNGGGIYNMSANIKLTNVIFSGNTAAYGGGFINYSLSTITLTNVTFSGNWARSGGAYLDHSGSELKIYNSIILGNSSGIESLNESINIVSKNSIIQEMTIDDENGNISPDNITLENIFVNPVKAIDFNPTTDGDFRLKEDAVIINKGDNSKKSTNIDLADNARIVGPAIDLGAYEVPAYLYVVSDNNKLNIDSKEGSQAGVRLNSNLNYSVSIPSDANWLSSDKLNATENDTITFTANINPINSYRTALVTLTETMPATMGIKSQSPILKAPSAPKSVTLTITQSPNVSTSLENERQSQLWVFPNPVTNGNLTINVEKSVHASIYDLKGSAVKEISLVEGKNQKDISDVMKGIYLIRTNDGLQVKLIVK